MRKLRSGLLFLLLVLILAGCKSGESLQDYLDLGQRYLTEAKYEEAIVVFDKAITLEPKCVEAYLGKADAYIGLGDIENAKSTITDAIELLGEDERLVSQLEKIEALLHQNERTDLESMDLEDDTSEDTSSDKSLDDTNLSLNYQKIYRWKDSEQKEIQLNVLKDGKEQDPSLYEWSSGSTVIADVTADGKVICKSIVGQTEIRVKSHQSGTTLICMIYVTPRQEEDRYYLEGEDFIQEVPNHSSMLPYYTADVRKGEFGVPLDKGLMLFNGGSWDYVYFSGDVKIPSRLIYEGEEMPVTALGGMTYGYCMGMTRITIPKEIESMADDISPFIFCTNLEEICIEEGNADFAIVDGVLFTSDMKTLLAYPARRKGSVYEIPASVENVYVGAFYGSKDLERIEVADGNKSFYSVEGVLVDRNTQTLMAYPSGKKETSYAIPTGVTSVAEAAFGCVEAIESIQATPEVTNLAGGAFRECSNLKEVSGLDGLETLILGKPNNRNPFADCSQLSDVYGGENTLSYDITHKVVDCGLIAAHMPGLSELDVQAGKIENIAALQELSKLTRLVIVLDGGSQPNSADIIDALGKLSNLNYLRILIDMDRRESDELQQRLEELLQNCDVDIN